MKSKKMINLCLLSLLLVGCNEVNPSTSESISTEKELAPTLVDDSKLTQYDILEETFNNKIVSNPDRELSDDLDYLPFLDLLILSIAFSTCFIGWEFLRHQAQAWEIASQVTLRELPQGAKGRSLVI